MSVSICYEVVYPALVRQFVAGDAEQPCARVAELRAERAERGERDCEHLRREVCREVRASGRAPKEAEQLTLVAVIERAERLNVIQSDLQQFLIRAPRQISRAHYPILDLGSNL